MRQISSKTGASTDTCSKVGKIPIVKVATDISTMTNARQRCRPIRSPRYPKINPPSGRAKKATAKVAKTESNAIVVPFDKMTDDPCGHGAPECGGVCRDARCDGLCGGHGTVTSLLR